MALEQGIDHAQRIHGFVDGVHKNGRPAGETFFGHEIFAAQRGL